ncbi:MULTISPECIES: 2-amino-4-hydroxy-6-hydroxymethyldihydropteridine diphosphokinase [Pontibacillus]|uniref:2-amino-4-hydroxy-6-hydroxymethyldihydropteridine diphosphokinase n=1 Tax=Pontibacillus chungwhensis TaxID=265426 RepID=A0ABY8UZN2_9BACI|nr:MULTISPECIES: 2-amino-4-hydroxy-6-hydroxymethyldihydropteridine diphosphokinase [Pontibacillus]MCD5326123.1 2-amino-4-hydroxy-6-hydroxymethyldihydropteridine diphosphokinase [Pontibacillus sp. HN14]WIF98221.1 2-amino-4-hydroxy-6-hydroxymethyldihydropteridine diphosphokinase [Pontibacillus chungwhensis]
MKEAYIALGSNIPPKANYLEQSLKLLHEHEDVEVLQASPIYETVPVGYTEQSDFLNMVAHIRTSLTAFSLLEVCQGIERDLGRERTIKWGPRTIDLDILLYNQENIETEELVVPHPRLQERGFVLVPLAELAPNLIVPVIGESVSDLLAALADDEKEGIAKWKPQNGVNE